MGDFETFQLALLRVVGEFVQPIYAERKEELAEVYGNFLLDRSGPTMLEKRLTRDEIFLRKVFYGFREIPASYEVLQDIETYVRRFPYKGTRVDRVRYLRFNIEAHLHEFYILHERLLAYLGVINKAYLKSGRREEVEAIVETLSLAVRKSLANIILIRGAHVHETRFSDPNLDRLATFDLLLTYGKMGEEFVNAATWYSNSLYRQARKEWAGAIRENNRSTEKLLDFYFGGLQRILFGEDGDLLYPVPKRRGTAS